LRYLLISGFAPLPIAPFPQLTRAPEGHHPPDRQHQGASGGRVPAASFGFIANAAFTEAADQDIPAGGQRVFQDFQDAFNRLNALMFRSAGFLGNFCDNACFGKGHPSNSV
jgi:hypothetical protein